MIIETRESRSATGTPESDPSAEATLSNEPTDPGSLITTIVIASILIPVSGKETIMAEIKAEREMSRAEVAEYFHTFADKLAPSDGARQTDTNNSPESQETADPSEAGEGTTGERDVESRQEWGERDSETTDESLSGEKLTFTVGNESTTINPPATVTFEMTVESGSSLLGSDTGRTASFALHWDETDVAEDDELSVQ
jgi:hypothetical protein